jgi:hypothetical protein
MTIKVTDIVYDTESDGVIHTDLDLPKEMTLIIEDDVNIEDEIPNVISDNTGWCVVAYNYEIL